MFPKFGPLELTLILIIVVMLFGVGKLPELFGAVGRGVREFRKNSQGEEGGAAEETSAPAKLIAAQEKAQETVQEAVQLAQKVTETSAEGTPTRAEAAPVAERRA